MTMTMTKKEEAKKDKAKKERVKEGMEKTKTVMTPIV